VPEACGERGKIVGERAWLSTIEAVSRNLRAVTAACRAPKTLGADAGSSHIRS
jgi:hypothetical protein